MLKRSKKILLSTVLMTSLLCNSIQPALAQQSVNDFKNTIMNEQKVTSDTSKYGDYTSIKGVSSYEKKGQDVVVELENNNSLRVRFLADNVVRVQLKIGAKGNFEEYPTPNNASHTATITEKSDADYIAASGVAAPTVTDKDGVLTISTKTHSIEINKETAIMKFKKGNDIVWEETQSLRYKGASTVQSIKTDENEYFYGGGTQNGRFSHKNETIKIVNTNNWVDQGVASPNPFYWTTDNYGVLRNTFKPGEYDFGEENANEITTVHNESRFDAYYFSDNNSTAVVEEYFGLTGYPVELPEYASYLGHLNAYNRDYWNIVDENTPGAQFYDGQWWKEIGSASGDHQETLNGWDGEGKPSSGLSARDVIVEHDNQDMPLGWFLPNDGYGCGYGQTSSFEGDIQNLEDFATYAKSVGVETGLWTQATLWPKDPENPKKGERDVTKEVEAGVAAIKTDVAWVGAGYSMALHGVSVAHEAISKAGNYKPNIVSLDGWAGTQRYAGIWSGDQYGGEWEYIRFHIPTYIGTSLSGQPNIGSDIDGIFGGQNPTISIRDFQFKSFSTYLLDMDGWGSSPKTPWSMGEPGKSINRSYLKLKAMLMPYINTISHEATTDGGLPMLRAMFLEESNDFTHGTSTEYQYMWGDSFLVAPIYQETAVTVDEVVTIDGKEKEVLNDIRNDIYLPSTSDIWIDYFTGDQYSGGQVLNNFNAPIWKMPIFVKNGAIIPMYAENNNPVAISESNPNGVDRSLRSVEFYPSGSTSFNLYEDDGLTYEQPGVNFNITSNVSANNIATLTYGGMKGKAYPGMVTERATEFVVNVSKAPESVSGTVNNKAVDFTAVDSKEAYELATGNVYFYEATPAIFVQEFASEGSKYETTTEITQPKLHIKSTDKVSVSEDFKVVIKGFENAQALNKNVLNKALDAPANILSTTAPYEITLKWDAVETATSFDVLVDGACLQECF